MFYENDICPVCENKFEAGDDVVTCPECGTPHHRACYEQLGHCFNIDLHSENFVYRRMEKPNEKGSEKSTEKIEETKKDTVYPSFANKTNGDAKVECENCGAKIQKGVPFCTKCGAKQPKANFQNFQNPVFIAPKSEYANNREKIDGETIEDISTVIGRNTKKFIDFFKKDKKASWNWGAFFFTFFYYFYRKMYKAGVIILAMNITITALVTAIFNDSYLQMVNLLEKTYSSGVVPELSTSQYLAVSKYALVLQGSLLVLNIICAIFANYAYKKKVFSVIKIAKTKMDSDDFDMNVMFLSEQQDSFDMDKSLLYKMTLSSKGGVSFIAPMIAYFVIQIISMYL